MATLGGPTDRGTGMDWRKTVVESLVQPRAAARSVIGLGLGRGALIEAAAAVAALAVVLGFLVVALRPPGNDTAASVAMLEMPFLAAALQFAVLVAAGFFTFHIGRLFGGGGSLAGALAIVVWLSAMMLLIQLAQLVVLLIMPPLAALLAVVGVFWALWAFASFVTELHGFQNPLFVLGGILLSVFVLFFGLAMLLAILGLGPEG